MNLDKTYRVLELNPNSKASRFDWEATYVFLAANPKDIPANLIKDIDTLPVLIRVQEFEENIYSKYRPLAEDMEADDWSVY